MPGHRYGRANRRLAPTPTILAHPRVDIPTLKARIDLRHIVAASHPIGADSKITCPFHRDKNPSCHIYATGFFCFSCGASGDQIDWLSRVHGLSTGAAIRELKRLLGHAPVHTAATPRLKKPNRSLDCSTKPLPPEVAEAHKARAARLVRLPLALQNRGFTLEDARRLRIAAAGEDAIFPVVGPDGQLMALKRRLAVPLGNTRYRYETIGQGTPAWCSPGFVGAHPILVLEGELNGMAAWLAQTKLAVMSPAGTRGQLYLATFLRRTVFIYSDGDEAGTEARERWARAIHAAGAAKIYLLPPWEMDACDLAARYGREALTERLS